MFLSTLYDQESSQMVDSGFFSVWLCFRSDFIRIKYVDQVGLTLQSNLISQTHELWLWTTMPSLLK